MSERLSASEFARREGCNEKQVRRALARGVLLRGDDGLIDAALIGTAWRKPNRRTLQNAEPETRGNLVRSAIAHTGTPGSAESMPDMLSLADALRLKETYLAKLRQLEYEKKAGLLIELSLAKEVVFELTREQRDSWLAWPVKVAPIIAGALGVDNDHLRGLLEEAVYQQLMELSEPDPNFRQD